MFTAVIIFVLMSVSALSADVRAAEYIPPSPPTDDFLNYFILIALLAIGLFILFIITRRNRNR